MKAQIPMIIVLCLSLALVLTFTVFNRDDDRMDRATVNLESEDFKLMRSHAKNAFDAKKYKQAIQIYEAALKMRPENAEVHNDLGATYYAFGLQYAGPNWPSWESDLSGKTVAEAERELETAVEQTGSGYIILKSDDTAVTEALIAKIKALDAHVETNLWDTYTELHILVGKTKEYLLNARNAYIRATDIKPTYGPAYRNLGSLYMKIGKTDHAIGFLENAYELDPSDEELGIYLNQFK